MKEREFYVIYEAQQIETLPQGSRVVTIDFWVEEEMRKRSMDFDSLADIPDTQDPPEVYLALARNAAREWYRVPQMSFFSYRGINVGEAFEPMVDLYLQKFLYYVRIFKNILAHYPELKRLTVPYSSRPPVETAGPLSVFELRAAVDAARLVAAAAGVPFVAAGQPPQIPEHHLYPRPGLGSLAFAVYNTFIRLAPRKPLKIFASEYWSHIAPIMEHLPDAELVLMERSEIKKIPWRLLWRNRIRFIHPLDRTEARREAAQKIREFCAAWPEAKKAVADLPHFVQKDFNWWGAVEPAFSYLVEHYAERVAADTEALGQIMRQEGSNRVVLRASIGGRLHHFLLAARVARTLGISSIEVQHAGAVFDPQSVHSRLEADFLAAYGEVEREQYAKNGYAPERIVPVGSPRFDRYEESHARLGASREETLRSLGLDPSRPVALCAVPAEQLGVSYLDFDSYDIADFLKNIRTAQEATPGLQILFKFRPKNCGAGRRAYIKELFTHDVAVAEFEDPFALMCANDIIVSGNSTMMYEAMLAYRPLALYPWKDGDYQLPVYKPIAPYAHDTTELALIIGRLLSDEPYRVEVQKRQANFVARHRFDGSSALRSAELIRDARV